MLSHTRTMCIATKCTLTISPYTRNGDTPSHHAFRNNMREIGEFLVSKGASVSAANNAGVTVYEEQRLMFQRLVASGEIHAADAPSTDALLSPEVALLKKYFDEHSAGGQQGLGGGGGAGGRSATMDFREFLTALPGLELTIDKVCSTDDATCTKMFVWLGKNYLDVKTA